MKIGIYLSNIKDFLLKLAKAPKTSDKNMASKLKLLLQNQNGHNFSVDEIKYVKNKDKKLKNSTWWEDYGFKAIPKLVRNFTTQQHDLKSDGSEDKEYLFKVLKKNFQGTNTKVSKSLEFYLKDTIQIIEKLSILNKFKANESEMLAYILQCKSSLEKYFNDNTEDNRRLKSQFLKLISNDEKNQLLELFKHLTSNRNDVIHHQWKNVKLQSIAQKILIVANPILRRARYNSRCIVVFNAKNLSKLNPLIQAVITGNIQKIKTILIKDPKIINEVDQFNRSALHYSVDNLDLSVTKILLENHADPNTQDIYKKTPLHNAVMDESYDLVNLLLKYGSNVDMIDYWSKSPLDVANSSGNNALISMLLPKSGIFEYDAIESATGYIYNGEYSKLKELIEKYDVSLNLFDSKGNLPITSFKKLDNNTSKIIRYLIEKGVDINKQDYNGNYLLFEIMSKSIENFQKEKIACDMLIMLVNNISFDISTSLDETIYHLVVASRNLSLLKLLIKHDVKVKDRIKKNNIYNISALEMASLINNNSLCFDFMEAICEAGGWIDETKVQINILRNRIDNNDINSIKWLLLLGVNPLHTDANDLNSLFYAKKKSNNKIFEILYSHAVETIKLNFKYRYILDKAIISFLLKSRLSFNMLYTTQISEFELHKELFAFVSRCSNEFFENFEADLVRLLIYEELYALDKSDIKIVAKLLKLSYLLNEQEEFHYFNQQFHGFDLNTREQFISSEKKKGSRIISRGFFNRKSTEHEDKKSEKSKVNNYSCTDDYAKKL